MVTASEESEGTNGDLGRGRTRRFHSHPAMGRAAATAERATERDSEYDVHSEIKWNPYAHALDQIQHMHSTREASALLLPAGDRVE